VNTVVEHSPLPTPHAVRTLLEDLVGRKVELTESPILQLRSTHVLGAYVTDRLTVTALAVLDLGAAARLGGALSVLPAGAVDDAVAAGELPEMMWDSCYEVLNVFASLFNISDASHVRLYEMYGPEKPPPGDLASLSAVLGGRLDVALTVAGYGKGLLSVVVR
jgi:hypothetical protein